MIIVDDDGVMHKVVPVSVLQDILDKIRAEIKHFMYDINPSSSESDYACNYILQIIDKYKAETEDEKC